MKKPLGTHFFTLSKRKLSSNVSYPQFAWCEMIVKRYDASYAMENFPFYLFFINIHKYKWYGLVEIYDAFWSSTPVFPLFQAYILPFINISRKNIWKISRRVLENLSILRKSLPETIIFVIRRATENPEAFFPTEWKSSFLYTIYPFYWIVERQK